MRRRILFVTDVAHVGGASVRLVRLAKYLSREHWTVACVVLGPPGPLTADLRKLGVEVWTLGIERGWHYPGAFMRLLRLVSSWRPAIIHAQLRYATFMSALAGRLLRVRAILSTRPYTAYPGKHRFLDHISTKLVTRIIAVSESAKQVILKEGAHFGKVDVIPNGVPAPQIDPSTMGDVRRSLGLRGTVVGTVGNLLPIKGQRMLVDAVIRLVKKGYELSLVIVGEGPVRDELEAAAESGGIAKRLYLPGEVRPVWPYLFAMDIFVLPSLNEGMSNALLEAMAAGRPIVATCVGGTPEVVEHDVSGLLIEPGDAEALAEAIKRLLDDQALGQRMGAAAAARVRAKFNLDRMEQAYADLYEHADCTIVSIPAGGAGAADKG